MQLARQFGQVAGLLDGAVAAGLPDFGHSPAAAFPVPVDLQGPRLDLPLSRYIMKIGSETRHYSAAVHE